MLKPRNWIQESVYLYVGSVFVVLIILAGVAFFKPNSFAEGCNLGTDLACIDYKVSPTGAVIAVKNNLPTAVEIQSASLGDCITDYRNLTVKGKGTTMITIEGCDISGKRVVSDLTLKYKPVGLLRSRTLTGNLVSTVTNENIYDYYQKFQQSHKQNKQKPTTSSNQSIKRDEALPNKTAEFNNKAINHTATSRDTQNALQNNNTSSKTTLVAHTNSTVNIN